MKKVYPKSPKSVSKGTITIKAARSAFRAAKKAPAKIDKKILMDTKAVRIVRAA